MTGSTRPDLAGRQRTAITTRDPRVRIVVVLLVTVGLVAVAAGGLVALRDLSVPVVGDVAVASDDTGTLAVDYVDAPSVEFVVYQHGREIHYALELRNDGPVPITIEDVPVDHLVEDQRLIRPTAVLLGPDETDGTGPTESARPFEPFRLDRGARRTVLVTGEFANCAYYTERAVDVIRSQPVTWSLAGWSRTDDLGLSRHVVVRSPHIRSCPDRVMDRGAATRTG